MIIAYTTGVRCQNCAKTISSQARACPYCGRLRIAVSSVPPTPGSAPLGDLGLSSRTKQCPYCAETIRAAAIKCRFCQSELPEVVAVIAPAEPIAAPLTPTPDALAAPHKAGWRMIAIAWLAAGAVIAFLLFVSSQAPSTVKFDSGPTRRTVTIRNSEAIAATCAIDKDSMRSALGHIARGTSTDMRAFRLLKTDGLLGEISNGTRAFVEGEDFLAGSAKLLHLKLLSGYRGGTHVYCASTAIE